MNRKIVIVGIDKERVARREESEWRLEEGEK
jgi:hypothetical protein